MAKKQKNLDDITKSETNAKGFGQRLKNIEKDFSKGAIMRLGDEQKRFKS